MPEETTSFHLFLECPGSLVYAEWIWLKVVDICFGEGGVEPSSLFLSEVLVLTLNLLSLKNCVPQVGRRIAFTARGLESFQESRAT